MRAELLHHKAVENTPATPPPATPQVSQLGELGPAQRKAHARAARAWLKNIYFDSARDRAIRDSLNEYVEDNTDGLVGTSDIFIITGDNCLGKSMLINQWAFAQYRQRIAPWTDPQAQPQTTFVHPRLGPIGVPHVPVLLLSTPAGATVKTFDEQLFMAFDYDKTAPTKGHYLEVLRRHRVELVVLDDLHMLANTPHRGRLVLDHVKEMLTAAGEYGISFVVVGANLHQEPIMDDPQVMRRSRRVELHPYSDMTEDDAERWQWLLNDIEERIRPLLPGAPRGMLHDDLPDLLLARTGGYMRDLALIAKIAPVNAILDGSSRITADHVNAVDLSAGREDERIFADRGRSRRVPGARILTPRQSA